MPPSFRARSTTTREAKQMCSSRYRVVILFLTLIILAACVLCVLYDFINAMVSVFHTEFLAKYQVQNSCQNTGPHNLTSSFLPMCRKRDLAERPPFNPVVIDQGKTHAAGNRPQNPLRKMVVNLKKMKKIRKKARRVMLPGPLAVVFFSDLTELHEEFFMCQRIKAFPIC